MKKKRYISSILVVLMILGTTSEAFAINLGYNNTRLGGPTRYSTAVEISREFAKNDIITNVILGRSDDFADSISATSLSVYLNAPILLTQKDSLNDESASRMKEMGIKNVYILGGTGVISIDVQNKLRELGYNVIRYGGQDRIETNRIIMNSIPKYMWGPNPKMVNGSDWVQGMSVAVDTKYYNATDGQTYINPVFVVDSATSTYDEVKDIVNTLATVQTFWESKAPGTYRVMLDSNMMANAYNNIPEALKNISDTNNNTAIASNLAYTQSVIDALVKPFGRIGNISSGYNHSTTDANIYINSNYKSLLHSTINPYQKHGALLTNGDNFIDALAVTPLSGKYGEPIVMANNSVSKVLGGIISSDEITSYFSTIYDGVNAIYYIGGTSVIQNGSENFLNGN